MLATTLDELERRAGALARAASDAGFVSAVVETEAVAGGGSGAESTIPSRAVALGGPLAVDELASRLRAGELPVIGRIEDGRLLLDLRTVAPEEDTELLEALRIAARTPIHLSGS